MITFINMVITVVKNESPDMILVTFDEKFNKKKDEIPPGVVDLIYFKLFNIGNWRTDIKHKNNHNSGPRGPHGQNLACTFLPYCQRFL